MTDIRQQLQASLGAAYTLERELGGGGMSRVFVATDATLNRRVVVKLLAPELAQELSAERFAREIKLAAALQDPHIVPVLSTGTSDGLPYYTMPFVEGDSLRARLLRGPIPVNDAVGILRDVALALEYAHARGIVHRDIKPENVLLAGRSAVVADFGIAKAVSAARTGPATRAGTLTSIGQSLGTPAYMAPEQVAGEVVDHRADLYAWGVMAYELLAGRHPFAGKTSASQLMAAQLSEIPVPLIDTRPGLAPPVAALVTQCLEKSPDARPQSASEVVEALAAMQSPSVGTGAMRAPADSARQSSRTRQRRLGVSLALAVVVFGAAGVFLARRGSASSSTAANAHSIAVLPFENLGDSADAYFADGITDAVRGKLTALPGVAVIARGSSSQYRKTTKLPRDIAKELGVRYLLTGTVRFASGAGAKRVQVSPELVEITDDGQPQSRWQQPFDAEVQDVFRVQADIAGKVAEAMQVALAGGAEQLAKPPTTDPAAYDAFLRGEAAWNAGSNTDPASLRGAATYFEQAVAHDSAMAEAWGALSRVYTLLYNNATPTTRLAELALTAARRAIALDPDGAAGHRAMGVYHRIISLDQLASMREYELARRAAPSSAAIVGDEATVKSDLGRLEESQRDRDAAIRLDPRNPRLWTQLSQTFLRLYRPTEARAAAERAVALAPTSLNAISAHVIAEAASGNLSGARQAIAEASKDVPPSRVLAYLGQYWDMGWVFDSTSAEQVLALGPETFDDDRTEWAMVRAQQFAWRGDTARARAMGDTASRGFTAQLKEVPRDPQRHTLLGLALAYAGRGREAMDESARGLALARADTTARMSFNNNAYLTYLSARIALLAGDRNKSLELLSEAIQLRYFVTPAWLRIDPTWKSLRGDPRFEKLATP